MPGQVPSSDAAPRGRKRSHRPSQNPPPARRSAVGRVGLPPPAPATHLLMPQMVNQGSVHPIGNGASIGMDLLRHRVHPHAGLGGQSSHFVNIPDDGEEINAAMESGYYFTSLISNGLHDPRGYAAAEPYDTQQPDDTQAAYDTEEPDDTEEADDTEQPDDTPQGKGPNFSSKEDELIVSAWLNVSMDGKVGVDQSNKTYWKRIHQYYHKFKKFPSDRSQGSLMNRWGAIRHDVNAFCGCVSMIEARNQSGYSIDDKIASACAMFKEDDKDHKNFAFMHCWRILKDKPKWINRPKHTNPAHRGGKKQKASTKANSSATTLALGVGNVDGDQASGTAVERPPGKKKELQRLRQRSSMEAVEFLVTKKKEADAEKDLKKEDRWNKAFALQEERNKIERERVEFKRQLEEERIMNIDTTTTNYKQQQYYERLQDEILAKRLQI